MNIAIVGQGNVAHHLRTAYLEADVDTIPVNSHMPQTLPGSADVVFLAVSDDAIAEVASRLPKGNYVLVHLSGTTPLDVLKPYAEHCCVAWPMQTFAIGEEIGYNWIPFYVEASDPKTFNTVVEALKPVSTKVFRADYEHRQKLHLACVFANNFVNHLYACTEELLKDCGETFQTIKPLIAETFARATSGHPALLQTGPAVRHDYDVISRHMAMLSDKPDLQAIYQAVTDSILTKHKK